MSQMFTGSEIVASVCYFLFVLAIFAPPDVLLSSGLTVENIFYKLLGSEEVSFVNYHLRRTTLTRGIFGCLPLAYCLALKIATTGDASLFTTYLTQPSCLTASLALAAVVWAHLYIVWFSGGTWKGHPTVTDMECISKQVRDSQEAVAEAPALAVIRNYPGWKSVAAGIDNEFRSFEKFIAFSGRGLLSSWPGRRIVATPSFLLFSYRTVFKTVCQAGNGRLTGIVVAANTVQDTRTPSSNDDDGFGGAGIGSQTMATVRIIEMDSGSCCFTFSIPASDLDTFRGFLQFRLILAPGVELEPTIVQQFITVFADQVRENSPFRPASDLELEQCIGCMSQAVNVRLHRNCGEPEAGERGCGECKCRPMWCLDCLARWFAARAIEDHKSPSDWLSHRVSCPTCRTLFCVRDVTPVDIANTSTAIVVGATN